MSTLRSTYAVPMYYSTGSSRRAPGRYFPLRLGLFISGLFLISRICQTLLAVADAASSALCGLRRAVRPVDGGWSPACGAGSLLRSQ